MIKTISLRLLFALPLMLSVLLLVGSLIHLVPGNPVDIILGDMASEADKIKLATTLGLDRPFTEQISSYLGGVFKGDLGISLLSKESVVELLVERIAPTVQLAFLAVALALCVAMPLGILSATHAHKPADYLSVFFALLGISMPTFWTGPVFVLIFSLYLGWLPVSEKQSWQSYILPTATLAIPLAAILTRVTRNAFLEVLKSDFLRTARAKGLSPPKIILKHAARNALLPIITVVGLQFGALLTGAVITEKIFDWPGMGSLFLDALNNRDYPLIQGCVLFFALSYTLVNTMIDIIYTVADPRVQLK